MAINRYGPLPRYQDLESYVHMQFSVTMKTSPFLEGLILLHGIQSAYSKPRRQDDDLIGLYGNNCRAKFLPFSNTI